MKPVLPLLLLLLPWTAVAQGEWEPDLYPPVYYKETPFSFERLDSLPVLRVRDTVWVADIDALLKTHLAEGTNLNALVKDANVLRALLDSLDSDGGERLYYNFFMRHDSLGQLSDGFVVRQLEVDDALVPRVTAIHEPAEHGSLSARREILLRLDGSAHTARFIGDNSAIRRTISYLFTEMSRDGDGIEGINIYLPDYDFSDRRKMVQFVKSIRIVMDASRDFKFGKISLNIFFHAEDDRERTNRDFIFSLGQEASSIVFLEGGSKESSYLRAREYTAATLDAMGLGTKIRSHLMIARFYTGDLDLRTMRMTDFSESGIEEILKIDYPENRWEEYLLILIAIVVLFAGLVVLFRWNAAVSQFVSRHTESVLLVLIVIVMEIGILLVTTIQNMCGDDRFAIVERHPVIIFALPLAVVLSAPMLHYVLKNRKTP